MIDGFQVSVGTAATEIVAPADTIRDHVSVVVENRGAASVFLGGSGVTTGTGFELVTGGQVTLVLSNDDTLYGIAAAAQTVHVLRTR